jgi:hypothetical protein
MNIIRLSGIYLFFERPRTFQLFVILFFLTSTLFAQQSYLEEEFELPELVKETSGLIFLNDRVITHNDSGGSASLFEIDTLSSAIVRTVTISNATNIDWEDISQDDTHIYIGDIGNVSGDRQDLKIYKIAKSDYLGSTIVSAEIISFSYEDQTDFTTQTFNTNFDAEAMAIFQNNIVIFTKNWIDFQTNAYVFPKTVGTHEAEKVSTYNSQGFITGADFQGDRIMLTGYDASAIPFLVFVHENRPPGLDFFGGEPFRIELAGTAFLEQGSQIEAITYYDFDRCFISREFSSAVVGGTTFEFPQKLYDFTSDLFALLSVNDYTLNPFIQLSPNPAIDSFTIRNGHSSEIIDSVLIFDHNGRNIQSSKERSINVQQFSSGIYFVQVQFESGKNVIKKLIVN